MDIPPSTRTRLISAMTSRPAPAGSVMPSPSAEGTASTRAPRCARWCPRAGHGPGRVRSIRPASASCAPASSSEIGPCADDAAAVHDGDGVAGPLNLIEEVGGQHDRAAIGHHRKDHVTHLQPFRPGRARSSARPEGAARGLPAGTRRPPGAGAFPWSIPRPGRRRGWARPTRSSAGPMRSRAAGSRAAARSRRFCLPVRWRWNRGSSTMAPTRASAASRCLGTGYPSRDIVPASARVNPSSTRMSVVLPAPLGPR